MKIKNIEGYSGEQLRQLVAEGGKFVMYKYCISVVLMSFNNPTDVYFIKPGNSRFTPGVGFLLTNVVLGWWGIPWGPIYTIGNISSIVTGGKDVTAEIMSHINQNDPGYGAGTSYSIPGQSSNSTGTGTSSYNIPGQNSTNNNQGSNTYNIR